MKLPPEQDAIRAKCFHPSGTFVEFPMEDLDTSIPARFENIVRLYPQRVAVKTKTQALLYSELNQLANQLARVILMRKGGRHEPVGLCLTDGAHLIMAHLAVLKAGKFSVSLDPLDSPDRIRHLLSDSRAGLVITDKFFRSITGVWGDRERLSRSMSTNEMPPRGKTIFRLRSRATHTHTCATHRAQRAKPRARSRPIAMYCMQ